MGRWSEPTERLTHTSKIYAKAPAEWHEIMPNFCFAHNNIAKEGERYSPAVLVYGQELRLPGELLLQKTRWIENTVYISRMTHHLRTAMTALFERRLQRMIRYKERYDRTQKDTDFKLGDEVLCWERHSKIGKQPRWSGPWIIKAITEEGLTVVIEMDGEERTDM